MKADRQLALEKTGSQSQDALHHASFSNWFVLWINVARFGFFQFIFILAVMLTFFRQLFEIDVGILYFPNETIL